VDTAVAKPEMVRTAAFLVAPIRLCGAGVQKGCGWHFRRPFLVHFLGEQKMNKKNEKRFYGEQKTNKK
jgi:hypothetical protein